MAELSSSGRKNPPAAKFGGVRNAGSTRHMADEIRARVKAIQDMEPLRIREPVIFRAKAQA